MALFQDLVSEYMVNDVLNLIKDPKEQQFPMPQGMKKT